MKPMRVEAGEASEIEELLNKAAMLEKMIEEGGDNQVVFEDVSGTNVRAQHYWTNREHPPIRIHFGHALQPSRWGWSPSRIAKG
jgi:ABC-type tungstate transport system permease subunit